MVSWLEHPRYVPARDHLVEYLTSSNYRFRRLPATLFLCGGANSSTRDRLRDYLRRRFKDLDIFYAERVWDQIAARTDLSALEMEANLAQLADLVIIVVESPGTFTELGAFSLSEPLRKKLVAIVDEEYQRAQSFISTGPLRWLDRASDFSPTIYVPLQRILECVGEVEERISRISRLNTTKISDLSTSPKHLLFFLCDLLSVIYPATLEMVEDYLSRIAPSIFSTNLDVPTLIGLAIAMGLLRVDTVSRQGINDSFLSPADSYEIDRPFHHTRLNDLKSLRASHVSVLLAIPEARAVLSDVAK